MVFKRARLRDFGPFSRLTLDFNDGLVGIVGPNGSGKSTLVEALYSGITGRFRKYNDLADYVRGLPDGGRASSGSLEVTADLGNTELVVRRTISVSASGRGSQSAKMSIRPAGGEEEIVTGVRAVDERLGELLQLDRDTAGQYVFVAQNAISAVVDGDPAVRTKALYRLFGLERFERIWAVLGEELSLFPAASPPEELAAAEQEEKQLKAAIIAARQQHQVALEALAAMDPLGAERDLAAWDGLQDLREQLTAAQQEIATLRLAYFGQQARADAIAADCAHSESQIKELAPEAEQARALLARAGELERRRARRAHLLTWSDQLAEQARSLRAPTPPTAAWSAEEEEEYARLAAALRQHEEFVRRYSGLTTASCPTCGQDIRDVRAECARQQKLAEELRVRADPLGQRRAAAETARREYECSLAAHAARETALKKEMGRAAAELRELRPTAEEADTARWSPEAVRARQILLSGYDGLLGGQAARKQEQEKQNAAVLLAKQAWMAAEARQERLQQRVESLSLDAALMNPAHIARCREVLRLTSERRIEVARWEDRTAQLQQQNGVLGARLMRLRLAAARAERINFVRGQLQSARALFHREQLPTRLAQRFVQAVGREVVQFLQLLQSSFTAELQLQEGVYRFQCLFNDTSVRESSSLSGGEKVRLSLAFLLAVNRVFAKHWGLLALDEPTAQLDNDAVRSLEGTLEYVRRYARNTGTQIFMITHCQDLAGSFDQTVSLLGGGAVVA